MPDSARWWDVAMREELALGDKINNPEIIIGMPLKGIAKLFD